MTLSDVLHEVMQRLELRPLTTVRVERGNAEESPVGGSEIHELRFSLDDHIVSCERRSFSDGVWGRWLGLSLGEFGGSVSFDIADVLATDWQILPP